MRTRTILFACCLSLPAAAAGADPSAPQIAAPFVDEASDLEDAPTPAELALARDRYRGLTVPVTIGGAGPFRFLVDTGAQATVITSRVAGPLALTPSGRAQLVAMGSSRMVETIELDNLEFANRTFSGLTAPLLEDQNVGADGILGLDTLQGLRVLIDFREDRMSVADAHELGGNNGYEIVVRARRKLGQMIITDADIDGVRTAVIIDTGAQGSHGNEALRRRLRAREEHVLESLDVNGFSLRSDIAHARKLRIGDVTLSPIPIGYSEGPVFAKLGLDKRPALILGMQSLQVFDRVAIDFSDGRVLFDVPKGAPYGPPRNRGFFP